MQFDSFQRFFSKEDPPPELSLQSIIDELNKDSALKIINWAISDPPTDPNKYNECIVTNQTFIRKLSISAAYKEEPQFRKQIIYIPSPTNDGEFILSSSKGLMANRYVMIMEINRPPGIYCKIKETDASLERTLTIKPLTGKQYKYVIKTNKKTGQEKYKHVGKPHINENFSVIGKKQIAHSLKDKAIINIENPILTTEEYDEIIKLFELKQLKETDDRSWINLKVNRIGDYFYRLLYNHLAGMEGNSSYKDYQTSIKKLGKSINSSILYSDLLQLVDSKNPLSEISQKRKLTFSKHPEFPSDGLLMDKRDMHPTDFGRVCSIESPQGKKLGFNLYLAKEARISSLGTIETPFKNTDTGEEIYLDPFDELEKVGAIRSAGEASDDRAIPLR